MENQNRMEHTYTLSFRGDSAHRIRLRKIKPGKRIWPRILVRVRCCPNPRHQGSTRENDQKQYNARLFCNFGQISAWFPKEPGGFTSKSIVLRTKCKTYLHTNKYWLNKSLLALLQKQVLILKPRIKRTWSTTHSQFSSPEVVFARSPQKRKREIHVCLFMHRFSLRVFGASGLSQREQNLWCEPSRGPTPRMINPLWATSCQVLPADTWRL